MRTKLHLTFFLFYVVLTAGAQTLNKPVAYRYESVRENWRDLGKNEEEIAALQKGQEKWLVFLHKKISKLNFDKPQIETLQKLHKKIRSRYLLFFDEEATLQETLEKGRYNCLTATVLWADALSQLGYAFRIREEQYHAYLELEDEQGNLILLEPTLGSDAVKYKKEALQEAYARYEAMRNVPDGYYETKTDFTGYVTPEQLLGLLLYNRAVFSFNTQAFEQSLFFIRRAEHFYKTPRLQELFELNKFYAQK